MSTCHVYAVIRIMINTIVFFLSFICWLFLIAVTSRNWFRTNDEFSWSGEFTGDFLSHLSHLEFFERVESETKRPDNERLYQLVYLAKQHSCLFCRYVMKNKSRRFNPKSPMRYLFHFACSVSIQFEELNLFRWTRDRHGQLVAILTTKSIVTFRAIGWFRRFILSNVRIVRVIRQNFTRNEPMCFLLMEFHLHWFRRFLVSHSVHCVVEFSNMSLWPILRNKCL